MSVAKWQFAVKFEFKGLHSDLRQLVIMSPATQTKKHFYLEKTFGNGGFRHIEIPEHFLILMSL